MMWRHKHKEFTCYEDTDISLTGMMVTETGVMTEVMTTDAPPLLTVL